MPPRCFCPKWFDVFSLDAVYTLIYKYVTHPEYGAMFSIHQPCFMCRNDDRTEGYATDEFRPNELFATPPHPETLNYFFVGCKDTFGDPPVKTPERVSVSELHMRRIL